MKTMRRTLVAISVVAVVSVLGITSAHAQTASQVVDRYVELIGGSAAISGIQTLQYERILTHIEEAAVITNTVYHKRPDRYRIETESGVQIVNGDSAWWGARDSSGALQWTDIDVPRGREIEALIGWFVGYRDKGYELALVGTEAVDGIAMHQVRMTWPDGMAWDFYFDVDSGMYAIFKPDERFTVRIHDYRRVSGVLFPHFTEGRGTMRSGQEIHHLNTIVSLTVNQPMSDMLFVPDGAQNEEQ